jgi:hypothetical protein
MSKVDRTAPTQDICGEAEDRPPLDCVGPPRSIDWLSPGSGTPLYPPLLIPSLATTLLRFANRFTVSTDILVWPSWAVEVARTYVLALVSC